MEHEELQPMQQPPVLNRGLDTNAVSQERLQFPTINILGVQVHALSLEQLLNAIGTLVDRQEHAIVAHVNAHGLNLASSLPWLRSFLNRSTIVFCDGSGVQLAARLLGGHLPERITYADWTWQLADYAACHNLRLFLLGARQDVAARAAQRLQARCPHLVIAGTHHGYFDKTANSAETRSVIEIINQAKPHILLVGFGMPMQEHWLLENWERIDANVALPAGAVFDYISGELRRGPQWMTHNGMEWLARLLIEPRRLWQRYVIGNPLFIARVLRQRFGRRLK